MLIHWRDNWTLIFSSPYPLWSCIKVKVTRTMSCKLTSANETQWWIGLKSCCNSFAANASATQSESQWMTQTPKMEKKNPTLTGTVEVQKKKNNNSSAQQTNLNKQTKHFFPRMLDLISTLPLQLSSLVTVVYLLQAVEWPSPSELVKREGKKALLKQK